MKLILKIVAAILLVAVAAYGINWQLSKNKGTMQQEIELSRTRNTFVPVKVATVEKKSFKEDFTVNGTFQPSKEVTIVSDVNGKITKLNFDDGSYVQAGNILLTVDNELLRNDLELSELDLEKAGRDLQRMENLLGKGGVTEVQVEEAKLRVNNLKVKIKSLKKRLNDTYVKAPISGIISQNKVENGSYLAPGTPVANIVNVSTIFLNAYLTEAQVVTVRKGQKVEVTADVFQGKKLVGTVHLVDVKADESKRFRVEIAVENPSGTALKAGMNGKGRFVAGEKVAALTVPREAFAGSTSDGEVFVVTNGDKATLRKVEAGETFGNMVEILSGLQEGETVVLTGQINLKDGATVKVIQ